VWGKFGCGKTTLLSTAVKPILVLQFDITSHIALAGVEGCYVYDLSNHEPSVCSDMMFQDNPLRLHNTLRENGIRTLVFDSLTTYYHLALRYVVGKLRTATNSITMETPSQAGYAQRNSVMRETFTAIMGLTGRLKIDTLLTLHEDTPHTVQRPIQGQPGKTMEVQADITPAMAMSALNTIGIRMSEVWHMKRLADGTRWLSVRETPGYTPMKTRMFDAEPPAPAEFQFRYDARTQKGDGIASWIDAWRKGGGRKIALPR